MIIKESKIVYSQTEIPVKDITLKNNKNIYKFITYLLGSPPNSPTEYLLIIALDDNAKPVSHIFMGHSSEDEVSFSITSVLRFVILTGCSDFIVVHNHPNDDPTFSNEDIQSAKDIKKAAKVVGLNLRGDYLVSGNKCIKNKKI